MSLRASRYPRTSSSSRSRSSDLPKITVAIRAWSTTTPSIRLDETALSIRACSRKTLSLCGDCFVKSSCLPRASPRSARYHEVVVGMLSGLEENCWSVIMLLACHTARLSPEPALAGQSIHFDLMRREAGRVFDGLLEL